MFFFCANHIPLTWCIGRSQLNGDPIDGHQIPVTATTARHGKLQRNLIGKPSKGRVHNGVAHDGVGDPNDIVDVGRGGRAPLPTGMGRGGGGATVVVPDHDVDAHPFDTKDRKKNLPSVYISLHVPWSEQQYWPMHQSVPSLTVVGVAGTGARMVCMERRRRNKKGHRCHNSISLYAVNMYTCRTM